MNLRRYEHSIGGRTYVVEVSPVSATRWRAQLARLPGMPTSLMPFYGATPEEAAEALTTWLALIAAPAAVPGPPPRATRKDGPVLDPVPRRGLR